MEIKDIELHDIPDKTKESLRKLEKSGLQKQYFFYCIPSMEEQLKKYFCKQSV